MTPTPFTVELRGLHKHFGPVAAVDGIDLVIAPGEVVALLGPNGAGKTTTLDLLLGLQTPDSGAVALCGTRPRQALRSGRVGAVLQSGALLTDVTVRELLTAMSALQPHPAPMADLIAAAQVEKLLGRRTDQLSGGEAQRVRFALALAGDPELLILDEPTAGLDTAARKGFWVAVRAFASSGRTVLFSTHYLEEADEVADRIVLIAGGRVVADGPTTEIRAVASAHVLRATVPGATAEALRGLPGVSTVETHGDAVIIRTTEPDATLRALLAGYPVARDVQVGAAPLADAVLHLTGDDI